GVNDQAERGASGLAFTNGRECSQHPRIPKGESDKGEESPIDKKLHPCVVDRVERQIPAPATEHESVILADARCGLAVIAEAMNEGDWIVSDLFHDFTPYRHATVAGA